jgi:hypothetical protein
MMARTNGKRQKIYLGLVSGESQYTGRLQSRIRPRILRFGSLQIFLLMTPENKNSPNKDQGKRCTKYSSGKTNR